MTRTPEQEAFVDEMMHKKPKDVWQELWDARQELKSLRKFSWMIPQQNPRKPVYPEGEWHEIPVEGSDLPHEYMLHEGTTYIRAVEPKPLSFAYEPPPSIKGHQIEHAVFDEVQFMSDSWTALKEGDEVRFKEGDGSYSTKVVHVDERTDGIYVTFEDGTVFEPAIKFFKEEFDIDYNGHVPHIHTTPTIQPDPPLTVKEVYERVRDNLTSMETHKKKRKVPKIKPLKGGTDFTRD